MHITIILNSELHTTGQVRLAHPVAHHVLSGEHSLSEHAGTEASRYTEKHCGVVVVGGSLDNGTGEGGGVGRLEDTRSDEDSVATELQASKSVTVRRRRMDWCDSPAS